jgi:hypothetical protein
MEILNEAKDACKEELRDTHVEIVAANKANLVTDTHATETKIEDDFAS